MEDNEIIKALERCNDNYSCPTDCPLYEYDRDCLLALNKPVLDLINRQKAEIERLKKGYFEVEEAVIKTAKDEAVKEFLKKQEIELANNTDISAVGYQSVIELNIKILKEMGIE